MPFAPPVTIAVRPDSHAIALLLRAHAADEFFELRELLLDHADGRLVLELERLLVEFLRGEGDDDLRPAEKDDVDRGQRLPQVILHARADEDAAGGRLQRNRLLLERLLLHARHPPHRRCGWRPPRCSHRPGSRSRSGCRNCRSETSRTAAPGEASFPPAPAPARCARAPRCRSPCATSRRSRAHRVACQPRFTPQARGARRCDAETQIDTGSAGPGKVVTEISRRVRLQLFAATRAMKVANAASCCLMRPRAASSLSSPVFSSNLDAQLPTKISGLLSVKASRNNIDLRRSYCTRAPPTGPGETDCSATGLPANGWFASRDTQSIAFLRPPGMLKLYSGVQKITPSAARMASASVLTGAGKPVEFWISAL